MIIVSNHALDLLPAMAPSTIVRVNLAWYPTLDRAREALKLISNPIYLDYPQGRTKPPTPTITLEEALALTTEFPLVAYFAVSNIESSKQVAEIKQKVPRTVEFVPKIETKKGVLSFDLIVMENDIKTVMLDKEDLYLDLKRDAKLYAQYVDLLRCKAVALGVQPLELQGVIFA